VAAALTAHEGNRQAAALHLRRAEELMPTAAPVGDPLADTQIQVSIALGNPLHALEQIDQLMAEVVQIDPVTADEMLQHASHAAADLAERDPSREGRLSAVRYLERIEASRGTQPAPFAPASPDDVVHPALGALYKAQRAQCSGAAPGLGELWEAACSATERADMQYEHARALYCLGRHLLKQRLDKGRAAAALATSRHLAVQLGAAPLTDDVDTLASQAHLHLASTGTGEPAIVRPTPTLPASPPLTRREQEVLDGLLSGDTYAQIAARLFISDKTVSSHVSNILRKTGTATRIELAELAARSRSASGG
jgi:DNA-binding CsgD family transcriptional regulator